MSYTLRGRLESRLAASVLPFLVACALALALDAWWPLELAGAMIGAGLALDVGLYHRLLPYQPAWAAIPLGLVELTATMALVRLFDVAAPLEPALWFFLGSWVLAQVLGHAAGRSPGSRTRRTAGSSAAAGSRTCGHRLSSRIVSRRDRHAAEPDKPTPHHSRQLQPRHATAK